MKRETPPSATRKGTHAWYALRRTLPTWSFEANLEELVRCLPRYGADELIVKVDTEEFTHGHPPLDWVRRYQPKLIRIRDAMQSIGVAYSLNPWITVGHCDRGRDARPQIPGVVTMVGHDGTRSSCCACPISRAWREYVAAIWRLYAETRPHVVWVEDDIRTFNHKPVTFGCFCREHMRRFSRRIGRRVTREELVTAILKPGRPHRWRREYLDMQREVMNDTVRFLAATVHEVSPETCLGLMSSGPQIHCVDGRHWHSFADALADGTPLYSRPPMANYSEASLRGFYYSHDSIKITRHCMPQGTIEQTEVENVPFTRYANSAAFTFLEMAISFAYGSHGVTMNLFDHGGTPMEREPAFGRMLSAKKPFLDALASRAQAPGTVAGVRLLFDERQSYNKVLPRGAGYGAMAGDGAGMMEALESHGIPTTYAHSPVAATSGQTLRSFSDDAVRALLTRGLLLDGVAARVLFERGFGREIGLRDIEPPRCVDDLGAFGAEEFFDPAFGGADGKYLTLTMPDLGCRPNIAVLRPAAKARVVSAIVDPDARRRHPCMLAFENRLGGRVIVHAIDLASAYGVAFNHTFRAEQLRGAARWLARGRPPVIVEGDGVYPLAFRKDCGDRTLLGFFNLTLDPWPSVTFDLATDRKVRRATALSAAGRWRPSPRLKLRQRKGELAVSWRGPVTFDQPLFVTLDWAP